MKLEIPLAKVNEDFVNGTLQCCGDQSLRSHSTLLSTWKENFFSFYFEMSQIPASIITSFKQAVVNYLVKTIRFGRRDMLCYRNKSWSLSKNGNI